MSKVKKILLTFDYEPFLGSKSGSLEKCILQPTKALQLILNKYNAKAIFFVDILYILNLKKHTELGSQVIAITNQLKTLHNEGHYLFPHIHPHWLDAVYLKDENEFSLTNLSNYSLAKLEYTEIQYLFTQSIDFLKDIGINYSQWGYRAGGWCLQPFSLFKNIFSSEKIMYEFSVLPGYKNENIDQAFDFLSITSNTPYYFSDAIEIPDEQGQFIEFPISTMQFNKIDIVADKLVRKYLWKINDRGWGDGISAQTAALKSGFINREMVSIDTLNISKLGKYKKKINRDDYMHWISHPKMFTKHGLKTFDIFLNYAHSKFSIDYDFKKMKPNSIIP